ncbi:MAG: hypothetical protein E7239_13045, partial [Sarcina sp.]|nr:hypothetical protein [Sarcina sp.]
MCSGQCTAAAPGAADLYGLSVLAENVQITDTNKTRFYVLSTARLEEQEKVQTHAVFVASCEANRIDDIIVEIHNAGLELVTIHDRPEGSFLGSYNYIVEVESESGVSAKTLEKIPAHSRDFSRELAGQLLINIFIIYMANPHKY